MLIFLGLLVLIFGSGVAVGLFMSGAPAVSGASEKSTGRSSSGFFSSLEAQDRVEANTLLSFRIRELEKELSEQKKDQGAILADRMAFIEKYHQQIGIQPFDQNMKVTPQMAELLGLSKEEKQAVEQHLAEIKSELKKMEDADTALTKQTDNSVSYDIAADKQGDTLKDKLRGFLAGDMGDDKTKVFMDGSSWSFQSEFSSFLEDKRQIEISWTQKSGSPVYTVKQISLGPNGFNTSMTGSLQPEFQKYLPTGAATAP